MNRAFLTAPLAIVVSSVFMFAAAGPASASASASAGDQTCTARYGEIRAAALTAEAAVARQAFRQLDIGVKLCEAGNARAAGKKFAAAARTLGIDDDQQLAARQR